jgi:hypothetical protein
MGSRCPEASPGESGSPADSTGGFCDGLRGSGIRRGFLEAAKVTRLAFLSVATGPSSSPRLPKKAVSIQMPPVTITVDSVSCTDRAIAPHRKSIWQPAHATTANLWDGPATTDGGSRRSHVIRAWEATFGIQTIRAAAQQQPVVLPRLRNYACFFPYVKKCISQPVEHACPRRMRRSASRRRRHSPL